MLGVTKPTLYAYVSRGIVGRSTAADGRTSLYAREEIQRLAGRARARRGGGAGDDRRPDQLGDHGAPGRRRVATADTMPPSSPRTHTFEQVAELLWTGHARHAEVPWPVDRIALDRCRARA